MVQTKRSNSNTGIDDNANGSDANNLPQMEKGLKIWQAFLGFFGLMVTVITMIVTQSNKLETQRLRIEFLESVAKDHGLLIKEMANKNGQDYSQINNKLSDIMILLQNKADKK